ncbi:noggin-2 isoform X2 [Folsomia candida]|uniref:Noggin-2 n=1 Tax=Folsomia candida TaxID=158441 RepID=A0A226EHE3_FOLCA|nr:noggin-2 isoform X2 [Folsomia candida]OXA56537.1 Noggin-2 [Folsomia candida]
MKLVFVTGVVVQFLTFLLFEVDTNQHHVKSGGGDQYLMRPRPAKGFLAVTKLQEVPGSKYDPKPEDLDVRQLRIKMGKNFDPEVMSIRKPHDLASHPNGTVKFPFKRNKKGRLVPTGEIPKAIKKLQYGALSLPDGTKLRTRLNPKLRRKLVQFLWAYTSCPVYEKWRDLGSRFWPRWLKEGHCYTERSCSIPPGMSCKPSAAEYKILLRWHCQDYDKAKKCRWAVIRHPIVTACSCECSNKVSNDDYDEDDF